MGGGNHKNFQITSDILPHFSLFHVTFNILSTPGKKSLYTHSAFIDYFGGFLYLNSLRRLNIATNHPLIKKNNFNHARNTRFVHEEGFIVNQKYTDLVEPNKSTKINYQITSYLMWKVKKN